MPCTCCRLLFSLRITSAALRPRWLSAFRLIDMRPLLRVVFVPSAPINDAMLSTAGSWRMIFASCCCGLNWSAQHLREVYSQESQSPKFFAGVDLDAARSCPVGIACSRRGRFSLAGIDAASGWCFVRSSLPGAVRITEVDFHIRGHREGFVFGHLQPTIPRQRAPQGCWELSNLPAQCGDDGSRVFASHLDQGSKTRMPLHQCRDVSVFCATNQIAFPMTGDGAVLDFCGPFTDGNGIYDLTARVFKDTRVPRAAYAALRSQVPDQLFLQHSACLNEQATVNRFVGHAHALVIGIAALQPSRNLFRRPIQNQFTRNHLPQLHMNGQKAQLGPQGRVPRSLIRFIRSILRTATMTCHLPAHRRRGALQAIRDIANRRTRSEPPRNVLSLNHCER